MAVPLNSYPSATNPVADGAGGFGYSGNTLSLGLMPIDGAPTEQRIPSWNTNQPHYHQSWPAPTSQHGASIGAVTQQQSAVNPPLYHSPMGGAAAYSGGPEETPQYASQAYNSYAHNGWQKPLYANGKHASLQLPNEICQAHILEPYRMAWSAQQLYRSHSQHAEEK